MVLVPGLHIDFAGQICIRFCRKEVICLPRRQTATEVNEPVCVDVIARTCRFVRRDEC